MPSAGYKIAVHVKPAYARSVRIQALAALARRVLASEAVARPVGLSVAVTDDRTVAALNRRYRGRNEPTDVLSFSLASGDGFVLPPSALRQLGEILISYPMTSRQARAAEHGVHDELAHLLVHGLLHILGYDHERPRQARAMRAREDALLGRRAH